MTFCTLTSLLTFGFLSTLIPTTSAQLQKCSDIYTKNGQTSPPITFVLPTELVTIGRKYSNGKSLTGWSGPFDSLRGGDRYKGTTTNNIADTYLYQEASVTEMNGNPFSTTTTVTYCPLNMTKRSSALVLDGVSAERYDIWWTVSDTQNGIIKREQCMALARLPDANGSAISMSFQLNDGFSCPNDPVFPAPSGGSFATYKYALVNSAANAAPPKTSKMTFLSMFIVTIVTITMLTIMRS